MSKGLFDNLEDDNGFDFGDIFKNAQKKEKPKKPKKSQEEKFGVPLEDLFSTPPSNVPEKDIGFNLFPQQEINQESQKAPFNFRKDIPKDVLDCLLNCLCTKCQKKVEEFKSPSIFEINSIPSPIPNPSTNIEAEKKVMKMFELESEEEEYDDIEDDDDDDDDDEYEDDNSEYEYEEDEDEESTIKTREDIYKKLFGNGFEDKEEEEKFEENGNDFLGFKF